MKTKTKTKQKENEKRKLIAFLLVREQLNEKRDWNSIMVLSFKVSDELQARYTL